MPNKLIERTRQLAAYQAKVSALQDELDGARTRLLANLHKEYGFADADELIKAIRAAVGGRRGRRPGRPAKKSAKHRKHARITPEMKERIKAALKAGKTGGEVAAAFGVSLPSVYIIKKTSGLVKARKKPKAKKPVKAKKAAKARKKPKAEKAAEAEKAPVAEAK